MGREVGEESEVGREVGGGRRVRWRGRWGGEESEVGREGGEERDGKGRGVVERG